MLNAPIQKTQSNDYVGNYLWKMEKFLEDNIDFLKDPQAISHAFNLSFELIYSSFREKITSRQNNLCFNDLLFEAAQEDNPLLACDFGFIKDIHFFNFAKHKESGAVDIGIDFSRQEILDNCTTLEEGNSLFRKDTLAILYNNISGFFGNNIIEYCHDSNKLVLDSRSYSTVIRCFNADNNIDFVFCDLFKYLLKDDNNIQTCKEWFEEFEKNNYNCLDNTNYFFIQSNSGEGDLFEDNWKYVLYANIGVDSTKANKESINVFLQKFTQFLDRISIVVLLSIKEYQTIQKSNISAMAQVMTRNMSHNLGSHVFSNLICNDVYSMLTDKNILENNTYLSMYDTKKEPLQTPVVENNDKNLQLAYFNQYLKSRMDYLSEVVIDTPNMLTTKYIYNDVFKEFDRVRILLKYISGISDFKYTFCLKYNGTPLTEENDIAVAFPSDVLGTQAFYNIIENIIRNTAKHASCSNQLNTFTIEFKDVPEASGHYCVEIDNGVKEEDIDNIVTTQNKLIKESILDDENNNLRTHGLGVAEMKASAAFLRQVPMVKIDSYEYNYMDNDGHTNEILLEAINKNNCLGYRFYMQIPKEFLFVGNWDVESSKREEMNNLGIMFVGESDFVKKMEEGTQFAQPFLLYQEDVSIKVKELLSEDNDCQTLLPIRKLKLEKEDCNRLLNIISTAKRNEISRLIKVYVWTRYYEVILAKEMKNSNNKVVKVRTAFDPDKEDRGFVCNQVVFLHHSFKDTHKAVWDQVCSLSSDSSFETWIENLSSRTWVKLPLFNEYSIGGVGPVSDYVENIRKWNPIKYGEYEIKENPIKYEIFEAYHNEVIVLDERVQKFSKEKFEGSSGKYGGPIPCSELFKSTNVRIPETPLDPEKFTDEAKRNLEHFVDENINKDAFLLVHYTILERLYKDKTAITNKLNEWAKKAKRVVVTSGRGAHSLPLPPSVCYADLSSVLYAFVENRNKFTINDLLNQSRRKHE